MSVLFINAQLVLPFIALAAAIGAMGGLLMGYRMASRVDGKTGRWTWRRPLYDGDGPSILITEFTHHFDPPIRSWDGDAVQIVARLDIEGMA